MLKRLELSLPDHTLNLTSELIGALERGVDEPTIPAATEQVASVERVWHDHDDTSWTCTLHLCGQRSVVVPHRLDLVQRGYVPRGLGMQAAAQAETQEMGLGGIYMRRYYNLSCFTNKHVLQYDGLDFGIIRLNGRSSYARELGDKFTLRQLNFDSATYAGFASEVQFDHSYFINSPAKDASEYHITRAVVAHATLTTQVALWSCIMQLTGYVNISSTAF